MKKILLSLMMALSVVGFAQLSLADDSVQLSTQSKLSDAQKAELAATAARMASENAAGKAEQASPSKTTEVVKEWVGIGTAIGSGLAASAKELGIAANDFAQTPVGRFTVFLIAWHFIGGTILHVFFTLLWFFTTLTVFVWMYRRAAFSKTTTYYDKGAGPNGARKVYKVEPKAVGDNLGAIITVGSVIAVVIFIIMLFNI